jgi:cytochrome c1
VEKHLEDPQALSPGSTMPSFTLSPEEMEAIVSYLFSLQA